MRKIVVLFILIFSSFQFATSQTKNNGTGPAYVWIDATGEGRQVFAYFRNQFELAEIPKDAIIQLYASSNYSLWVNGKFLNYGPIRNYMSHPYFDKVDISSFLKKGKNVIAVKALCYGMNTYQVPFGTGGFIAWGNIESAGKEFSLNTPGNWICRKAQGYDQLSPQFSFAQGPIESFDAQLEPDDWKAECIQTKLWKSPVLLKNQLAFGKLEERTFPLLTNTEVTPKFVVSSVQFNTNEEFYNWHAESYNIPDNQKMNVLTYTNVYSPEEQDLVFGFAWGKYWLNGKLIKTTKVSGKAFRSNATIHLNKGWNQLFFEQEIIWVNSMDGMIAVPANANIVFSVNRKLDNPMKFALSELLTREKLQKITEKSTYPLYAESMPVKWRYVSGKDEYNNPAKEIAWFDAEKKYINPYQTTNLTIPAGKNQAIVYDLGSIQLGRIFVDIDAPAGTTIDLVWSEDLKDSIVSLYKRMEINALARFVAKPGIQHLETFRPFGLRYLQVIVRQNNQPVTILKTGVYRQVYPFQKKGSFTCSDPLLNDIWEMGWRTVQVCSEDSYTDTPFRERGHYAGDFFPEFATTLATSGDPRLAKQTIRLFNNQFEKKYKDLEVVSNEDFPLINILIAYWYIRMFNDKAFAQEVYPLYSNFLSEYHKIRRSDGFYPQKKAFLEWIALDKSADLTSYHALISGTMDAMSKMAKLLNKESDSDKFKSWSEELKQFIQTTCWDSISGNFVDGYKNGELLKTRFPISSTFPSIWNIPTVEQEKNLQNWLGESLINIGPPVNRAQLSTPYGGFYAMAALFQQGNSKLAEKYIRKHWGKMVLEANDLTWEDFNRNDEQSTMSHAWASSPTYYLSTQVLGVNLGFPGNLSADTIYIQPQSANLSWAKGTVPHPKGLVSVDWEINGDILFLNYSAPAGIPIVVKPIGRLANYELKINKYIYESNAINRH